MFSSAAAFFTRSAKALVYMSYKQACFFSIILLSCLQILHSKIPSPGKLVKTRHIMTSWPTNWVNWVTTFRTDRWQLFTLWTCRQLDVELSRVGVAIDTSPTQLNSTSSWVELCRYKRPFMLKWKKVHFFLTVRAYRESKVLFSENAVFRIWLRPRRKFLWNFKCAHYPSSVRIFDNNIRSCGDVAPNNQANVKV